VSESGERHDVLPPSKPLGLVVYLACSPGHCATREHLADLLWADLDVEAARHSVRQAVWFLRQRLGERAIVTRHGSMTLGVILESDRDAFLKAIEGIEFERALEHYHGDFLPGFAAPGGADFEHWADMERFRLRRLFLRAGDTVVRDWVAKGRLRRARELATRVRDADPLDQSGWRLLLETLLAAHDRIAVELEAQRLEATLAQAERPAEPATRALLVMVGQAPADSPIAPGRRRLDAELIGREREFAFILSAWDAARGGSGRHVHVTGAAGLGKSRLLADVHARLRAAGARTVAVRANPGERAVPCALAADLALVLAQLPGSAAVSPDSAAALVALNPTLSSQYLVPADRASDLEAVRRREIALGELLATVADEQSVAVLIDDVQWADDSSRQILSHVAARALAHRVLLVTTARPSVGGTLGRVSLEPLVLAPLSAAETSALLASLGRFPPEPWGRWLSDALHLATRGTPLLILETLHLLIERRVLALEDGVWRCPDVTTLAAELAKGGALRRRIDELARHEKWLLTLLATAGTPLDPDLLARAVNRGADAVQADLAALELRGFATRDGAEWQPAHDEIASRTLDLAPPEALRAAHTTIGRQLASSARDDPGVLHRAAHHLAAAGEERELARVFTRRVRLQRRRGERRPPRAVAAELLGDAATAARVSRLVRALPLYVRLGLVTPQRVVAVAVSVLVVGAGIAALMLRPPSPLPDVRLMAIRAMGDSFTALTVPIFREGWTNGTALDVRKLGSSYRGLATAAHSRNGLLRPRPDGRAWAFPRVSGDSGDIDLYLADVNGTVRRLTATPGDDESPSWSPDGRTLVFSTTRGNPNRYGHLALLDVATARVTELTHGEAGDATPFWSPDGTRIAYRHSSLGASRERSQICLVASDGTGPTCLGRAFDGLLGWYDPDQLLLLLDSSGTVHLGRLNVNTGETVTLDRIWNGAWFPSSDGHWMACWCTRAGLPRASWFVYPSDRPDLARRVLFGTDAGDVYALHWVPTGLEQRYLERLEISAGSDTVALGTEHRLTAQGFDATGDPVPLEALAWRSENTAVATVDESTGVLRPRRIGTVTIFATAGGWREVSFRLAVVPPSPSDSLMQEDWSRPIGTQWVPFGDPRPQITEGPGGKRAFWNHGDGWFTSGVYSKRRFGAGRGLGFEAWLSTPVVGPRQQFVHLFLGSNLDSAALAHWDHRTENLPYAGQTTRQCGFGYPPGDGVPDPPTIAVADSVVVLPSRVNSGEWYRAQVQIFPDGRCGLAIDGRPLGVLGESVPPDDRYWVVVEGNSLGNHMLVGPLHVWDGVRSDIDWSQLDKPAGPVTSRPAPRPPSSHLAASPTGSPQSAPRQRTPRPRP
jgi:DNA-binding SARP family transcriptional activator